MDQVRGRFAPSPTGEMHLGNAWTALLAWLQVRRRGGVMVLRIEDLDPDRSRPIFTAKLLDDMRWLGLDWDEGPDVGGPYGPYRQGERRDRYEAAVAKLTAAGLVYPCYCSRAELHSAASAPHAGEHEFVYPGTCRHLSDDRAEALRQAGRRSALRLRVPDISISFIDGVHGTVTQKLAVACGDFIIRRSDGVHAYQLAVVVDDGAMGITHVLRGDDLLASTPRQLLLYRLLGLTAPAFTHVPLLYGMDGHRLSKRQKDLSLAALRARGVSPRAIVGYLAWKACLLPEYRLASPAELIAAFDEKALPAGPIFVPDDLADFLLRESKDE